MKAYIQLVVEIDPNYQPLESVTPITPPEGQVCVPLYKCGTLYKQRDLFKGWRPRWFVLNESLLHYCIEENDTTPKKTIDLSGSRVTRNISLKIPPSDEEMTSFTISHPTMMKAYVLACPNNEAEGWIGILQQAGLLPPALTTLALSPHVTPVKEDGSRDTLAQVDLLPNDAIAASGAMEAPVCPEITLRGIPAQFSAKIESAVVRLVALISAPGWEHMYDENGMKALQKPGGVICVRGEITMPFAMGAVFDVIMDTAKNTEINPQVASAFKTRCFSPNTAVQHLKFKPVWPTAARDMVNLTHWRLLPDNRIVIISFAEKAFDDANPLDAGACRAELLIGGYILTPRSNATDVKYVVQSDLKGAIPAAVAAFVSRSQPRIILNIRTILEKAAKTTTLSKGVPTFLGRSKSHP